jgi:hypothetical protein
MLYVMHGLAFTERTEYNDAFSTNLESYCFLVVNYVCLCFYTLLLRSAVMRVTLNKISSETGSVCYIK